MRAMDPFLRRRNTGAPDNLQPHKLGHSIGSVGQAAALDAAEEILSVPILLTYLATDL